MACLGDTLLSESTNQLCDLLIHVTSTTANFKPQLDQLLKTVTIIRPIIKDIVKLNRQLDDYTNQESQMFIEVIQEAEKLVNKCVKIKWNLIKRYTHSLKLKDVNNKLLRFFQLEVQADQCRDLTRILFEVKDVKIRMNTLSMSISSSSIGEMTRYGSVTERSKLGWKVPILPPRIVVFDEPLKKLKDKVLADDGTSTAMEIDGDGSDDTSSILVVAAAGGSGKTTLVTVLCYDSDIIDKFGDNIFFVTVSETPNFMVIVNDLYNRNSSGQEVQFNNDEDAKNKLGSFLRDNVSGPMLLVLDDVWSDSFIDNFPCNIKGYKILVTSRTEFPRYDVFKFDTLSDEVAMALFRCSAFTESKKIRGPAIKENLVNEMVKCCKKHPLTLSVVGSSLNGRDETAWKSTLTALSHGNSVLDLNVQVRDGLERSFKTLDAELKECYLDFGLFPEDQRIPVSTLLDMWVHLYNHDDEGNDTIDKIFRLSFRNLVNLISPGLRKDAGATVNYCDQQYVTQHDLLRELAIHLSSKGEVNIAQRKRLIINARGEDLPASIIQVQEPMQARILSISTGETFSSRWCSMKVPKVEVMVLNLMSKSYTLPHFLMEMQKLKILNITNFGLYRTKIENLDLVGCLSNLTRIRFERVVISSLSKSILALENLQKVSFIMCKIGNAFEELSSHNLNIWPRLVEIEMDYCQDLVIFAGLLCSSVYLKRLSITNCNEMSGISEEFGKLRSLETLSLRSCTNLQKLPESIIKLQKLSVIDISDCLSLSKLPEQIGMLGGLRTIYMKGCTGILELPPSVNKLSSTQVVCDEEISYHWKEFPNVEIHLVEEDGLDILNRIM